MKTVLLLFLVAIVSACDQASGTSVPASLANVSDVTPVTPTNVPVAADPAPVATPTPTVTPAPTPTVTPTPSPTPTPVTVIQLNALDSWHICHDLEAWNPATTTTIVVSETQFSLTGYTFSQSGVTYGNLDGTNQTPITLQTINEGNPGNCVIHIANSQLVSVQ